jgi:chromosome partitioning protein
MSITVVAHTKGGVAKTTTAVNLGVMLSYAGKRVLMVDADTGQSLRTFSIARNDRADETLARGADDPKLRTDLPFIEVITLRGRDLHMQLKAKAADYDEIIVDVGGEGHGATEIRAALIVASRVVTPCRPNPADIARLDAINQLVSEARTINPTLDAMLFPTQASTNAKSTDVEIFYRDSAKFIEFRTLSTVVNYRAQYAGWAKTGEAVIEQRPRDKGVKAALAEMEQLLMEIYRG